MTKESQHNAETIQTSQHTETVEFPEHPNKTENRLTKYASRVYYMHGFVRTCRFLQKGLAHYKENEPGATPIRYVLLSECIFVRKYSFFALYCNVPWYYSVAFYRNIS